ncbi:ATP-binding protein [Terriglobus sp.]|uniref:ATP-binding protein n=1 Tax=Terriglobus sp. TaxID=1889013 RepID=UPI003AFFD994
MPAELSAKIVAQQPADVPATVLESCAQEPIRTPGRIQRHGFLLGLSTEQDTVTLASENAEEFLGVPLKLILGGSLEVLFERELLAALRQVNCRVDPAGLVSYLGAFQIRKELFSVVTHCVGGTRILEFERQDRLVGAEMMNAVITNFMGALARLKTEQELCQAFTDQFAALTGFDRALLYCFDHEGHGTVLTEANSDRLPSYLDLRFPATDIPAQARTLYVLNTVRIIPNANYTPSPVMSLADDTETANVKEYAGLNLSLSVLRSVSPVHLEYMRNMGTMSSMSVSIVVDGKLWGLISGHHAEPRTVPYLVRSACDMLSKMVGTRLNTFRTMERLRTLVDFHAVQRELLTQIAAEYDYIAALAKRMDRVMQVTHASGVVLWDAGTAYTSGRVPSKQVLADIVKWVDGKGEFESYTTRTLGAELPAALPASAEASGLLAIRLSDVSQRYLLWFKPEVLETVTWAGEPVKNVDSNQQLHPRTSFAQWQETFRGQSGAWSEVEQESAQDFRAALVTVGLQRAEEEAELNSARFLQLTHNLPTKVFTCDQRGCLTYVNQRWRDDGLSDRGEWFAGGKLVQEDEQRIRAMWETAVVDDLDTLEAEVRVCSAAGERWNLARVTPFRREGKRPAGWVGFLLDLTERREREDALRIAEKLALSGRMTSVIAHEINNPLESITNLLYLLRMELGDNGNAVDYIGMAEAELARISGITKQTLRWNREDRSAEEDFRAEAIFTEVLRLFQGKTRNRMIAIHKRYAEDVIVHGVIGQIRQVIANLVSNALDAARVGGNVTLNAFYDGDDTVFTVTDDGAGIPEAIRKQLFQPFFSTKGDLGNGLGLYISHEIVERHHGTLDVESAEGKGTTVRVRLPRDPKEPVTPPSQ